MLASKSMPDEDDIDGYTLGGLAINPLLKHKVALEAHYPFQQQDAQGKSLGNPAITTIDEIVKEVKQYDWQDSNAVHTPTLRNDLTTILIKTLNRIIRIPIMSFAANQVRLVKIGFIGVPTEQAMHYRPYQSRFDGKLLTHWITSLKEAAKLT